MLALVGPACAGFLGDEPPPSGRLSLPDASLPREGGDASVRPPSMSVPDADPSSGDAGRPRATDPSMDMCGDVRLTTLVYYGTLEPTYLPLTTGQTMADRKSVV